MNAFELTEISASLCKNLSTSSLKIAARAHYQFFVDPL